MNPDVIARLRNLHPDTDSLRAPASPNIVPSNLTFTPESLERAIKSFPSGSSPGPDGLRPQHLADVLRFVPKGSSNDVRPYIGRLMALFINGKAPTEVAPFFASARLIPLSKEDHGIRPIAVGMTWRRLGGKLVNLLVSDRINPIFSPIQFGVGHKLGSEIIVHTIRQSLNEHANDDDWVLFKADFSNAFNQVSRPAFLKATEKHLPDILPFIQYCYSFNPFLFVSNSSTTIPSLNGTQQGDPLGPLLFCLAIQELISNMSKDHPELLNLWFMDDGCIGGPSKLILHLINHITTIGPSIGIHLNLQKSLLFWPSKLAFTLHSQIFPKSIPYCIRGVVILGTPIGSKEFIASYFDNKLQKNLKTIAKLPKLNDPQISFTLLNKCLNLCKVGYYLRTTPSSEIQDMARNFDESTCSALEMILGTNLNAMSRLQIQLPFKFGGLGLRSALSHAPAAYISSVNACTPAISAILNSVSAMESLNNEKLESSKYLSHALGGSPTSTLIHSKSQHVISESIDKQTLSTLLNSSNTTSKARIYSCHGSQGSAVFSAPLAHARGFKLTAQEFNHFISTRLGLNNISNEGERCTKCNMALDTSGYHVSICKTGDHSVLQRHNQIRNILFTQCQRAAWSPVLEHPDSVPNSQLKPADILIPIGPATQPIALDITVVNPLSPNLVDKGSKTFDHANTHAEKRKHHKYAPVLSRANIQFKVLSVESFGRCSPVTLSFISKLATAISNRFGGKPSSVFKDIERKICISLIRSQARSALERIPTRLAF